MEVEGLGEEKEEVKEEVKEGTGEVGEEEVGVNKEDWPGVGERRETGGEQFTVQVVERTRS